MPNRKPFKFLFCFVLFVCLKTGVAQCLPWLAWKSVDQACFRSTETQSLCLSCPVLGSQVRMADRVASYLVSHVYITP